MRASAAQRLLQGGPSVRSGELRSRIADGGTDRGTDPGHARTAPHFGVDGEPQRASQRAIRGKSGQLRIAPREEMGQQGEAEARTCRLAQARSTGLLLLIP